MIRCRSFMLLSSLILCTVLSGAQKSASGAGAAGRSQQTAATPMIQTSSNLVLVDVVVSGKGWPVQGLKADQFQVLENGKEQRITSFEEHRAGDALQVGKVPALPPGVYSSHPRYALTSAANVLLLDALNTPMGDQMRVRQQMLAHLKEIPKGTRLAVFTLGSQLRMIEGFTTDAGAIEELLRKGKGLVQQSIVLETPQEVDADNGVPDSMGSGVSPSAGARVQSRFSADPAAAEQFVADTRAFETDLRVGMTLNAMKELGRYLATIPGRKNLIWFSGSFPAEIEPDLTLEDPFSAARQYAKAVERTDALLAAARVAVYPVDARGLVGLASVNASRFFAAASSSPLPPPLATPSDVRGGFGTTGGSAVNAAEKSDVQGGQRLMDEHQTMDQIAEETGGKAFYNTNALGQSVVDAVRNGANYYTIGYVPDAKQWNGKFRRIRVEVSGGKYRLEYRRGYYAEDATKPGPETTGTNATMVDAMQLGAPPLSQIIFEARALLVKSAAGKRVQVKLGPAGEMATKLKGPVTRYLVQMDVDPHGIAWKRMAGNGGHAQLEVTMVAWSPQGKRLNYTDRRLGVHLTAQQVQEAVKHGLPLQQEIDLPAGPCVLRVAVRDMTTGRMGTVQIPLTVGKG